MCSGCVKWPTLPKDGGYLSNKISTPKKNFTRHDPRQPRLHGEGLQALSDRHICAYGLVLVRGPRAKGLVQGLEMVCTLQGGYGRL